MIHVFPRVDSDRDVADECVVAYLAGVIDSDGFITIRTCLYKGKRYHSAAVGISGTRREPHDLAASLWGGKVWSFVPKDPRSRLYYQWCHQGVDATPILEAIYPHLRIKQKHAGLALELQESVFWGDQPEWHNAGYSPVPEREQMRAEIMMLNQRHKLVNGKTEYMNRGV